MWNNNWGNSKQICSIPSNERQSVPYLFSEHWPVTGPWMRLVGQDRNIFELNKYYAKAQEKLQSWAQDTDQLLGPNPPSVFGDVPIKNDAVIDCLVKPTSFNGKTVTLLQACCQACLIIIERQFKDQLPGGRFWDPSEALRHQARSCSATNISSERNFAVAHQVIHRAPNVKPSHTIQSNVQC